MTSRPPSTAVSGDVAPVLLIGYGNELRGDDAAGPRIAGEVERWRLPGVKVLSCHQLVPELAELISRARAVVFVDSSLLAPEAGVTLQSQAPATGAPSLGHVLRPPELLGLARALYDVCPPAWLVTVPGIDFELGHAPSAIALAGEPTALRELRRLFRTLGVA